MRNHRIVTLVQARYLFDVCYLLFVDFCVRVWGMALVKFKFFLLKSTQSFPMEGILNQSMALSAQILSSFENFRFARCVEDPFFLFKNSHWGVLMQDV